VYLHACCRGEAFAARHERALSAEEALRVVAEEYDTAPDAILAGYPDFADLWRREVADRRWHREQVRLVKQGDVRAARARALQRLYEGLPTGEAP
jgi:hypothetical protein